MASWTRTSPIFIYIHQWSSVQHILSSEVAFRSSHHADCTSALSSGTPSLGWNSSCSTEIPPICSFVILSLWLKFKLSLPLYVRCNPHSLLSPILFGLTCTIQMNHHLTSRYLKDTLYSHMVVWGGHNSQMGSTYILYNCYFKIMFF